MMSEETVGQITDLEMIGNGNTDGKLEDDELINSLLFAKKERGRHWDEKLTQKLLDVSKKNKVCGRVIWSNVEREMGGITKEQAMSRYHYLLRKEKKDKMFTDQLRQLKEGRWLEPRKSID